MAKSDTGKILAIIGGLVGVVAVLLSLLVADLAWWQAHVENYLGFIDGTAYINAFAVTSNTGNSETEFLQEGIMILIGSLIFLATSILIIFTAVKEEKTYSILCSIGMIAGLFLFCYGLSLVTDLENIMEGLSGIFGESYTIFWGAVDLGVLGSWSWRLGNGFFIGAVAAGIALIGALISD